MNTSKHYFCGDYFVFFFQMGKFAVKWKRANIQVVPKLNKKFLPKIIALCGIQNFKINGEVLK